MSKGVRRWMACFDSHGHLQDDAAVAACLEFRRWWAPHITIHGGDAIDVTPLRRKASAQEQAEGLREDIEAGAAFLGELQPTIYMRGNHCERLWDAVAEAPHRTVREMAETYIAIIMDALPRNVQMFPYHKRHGICRLGHMKFLHGYHNGIYAARLAGQIYGAVLMGHVHTITVFSVPRLDRTVTRTCGCLCRLDLSYNRGQPNTLAQAHGWVYGLLYPDGQYICWQAECVAGRWVFPSELRSIKHKGLR